MEESLLLIVSFYIVFSFFEFEFPVENCQGYKGKIRNMFITLVLVTVGAMFTAFIYSNMSIPLREAENPSVYLSIFMVFPYMFLTDFIFYWYHRAQHKFNILWPIHELHHSETELNVTTSMRSFWLEKPIQILIITIPTNFIIGFYPVTYYLLPLVFTSWLFFTHANIKLRMGLLTPVFCGPQLHRIHHSSLPEHQGKNFAQFFPVIDILFGTYYKPESDEFPPTGTPSMATDTDMVTIMTKPIKTWISFLLKR